MKHLKKFNESIKRKDIKEVIDEILDNLSSRKFVLILCGGIFSHFFNIYTNKKLTYTPCYVLVKNK